MNFSVQTILKAITAAVLAGLGAVQVANTDGVITTQEWVTVAIVVVVAFSGVWAVPNAAPKPVVNNPVDPTPPTPPVA